MADAGADGEVEAVEGGVDAQVEAAVDGGVTADAALAIDTDDDTSVAISPTATVVPVVVHVAARDGEPVVSSEWIDRHIARANHVLAPTETAFRVVDTVPFEPLVEVVSVADRHSLAAFAPSDGRVHVFVVERLADKDVPGKWLNGVHWRYRGARPGWAGRRYVIMRSTCARDTLPHELGHYFGLGHVDQIGNLMSYKRKGPTFITDTQVQRFVRRRRATVRTRRVVPLVGDAR